MTLIDSSYFVGPINVTNTDRAETAERLQFFIDKYETEFLKAVLGYELYKVFIDGFANEGALGPELIVNGTFVGDLSYWSFGDGWTQGVNKMTFNNISFPSDLKQSGVLDEGKKYRISFKVSDGLSGFVTVSFGSSVHKSYNPWEGDITFDAVWSNTVLGQIRFSPSVDFNGSITNVSLKEIIGVEQRLLDIRDGGKTYIRNGLTQDWKGLIRTSPTESPIANYIYWHWESDRQTQTVQVGEVKSKAENAEVANAADKMVRAWNDMSKDVEHLYWFLYNNASAYPEWKSFQRFDMLRKFKTVNHFGI